MNATCLLNDGNAKSVFFTNSENCFGNKRKVNDTTTHKCSFAEASENPFVCAPREPIDSNKYFHRSKV